MSADLVETIGELRELLVDIRNESESTGYGFFPGGDPRTFTPDGESSTAEERAAHAEDCARADRGEPPQTDTRCRALRADDGTTTVRVTPGGYGLGVYTLEDPQAKDWADRLERCVQQLEGVALQGGDL